MLASERVWRRRKLASLPIFVISGIESVDDRVFTPGQIVPVQSQKVEVIRPVCPEKKGAMLAARIRYASGGV